MIPGLHKSWISDWKSANASAKKTTVQVTTTVHTLTTDHLLQAPSFLTLRFSVSCCCIKSKQDTNCCSPLEFLEKIKVNDVVIECNRLHCGCPQLLCFFLNIR